MARPVGVECGYTPKGDTRCKKTAVVEISMAHGNKVVVTKRCWMHYLGTENACRRPGSQLKVISAKLTNGSGRSKDVKEEPKPVKRPPRKPPTGPEPARREPIRKKVPEPEDKGTVHGSNGVGAEAHSTDVGEPQVRRRLSIRRRSRPIPLR